MVTKAHLQKENDLLKDLVKMNPDYKKFALGVMNSKWKTRSEESKAKLEFVRKQLLKHRNCGEYHSIEGRRATCLDVILLDCFDGDDSDGKQ